MSTIYSIALKLSLDGVNQLKNSFSVATQEIKKASSGITGIIGNSAKQMKELATSSLGQAVSTGAMIAGITKAIGTGIEFEDTFLRATAKIKDNVRQGSEEFANLEKLVLDLGASTEFSTNQAAQGLDFWAKAGKTTEEIMALLPKSLDMATASGLDLARASDVIANSLGIFNLNSSDMNELTKNTERIMDSMVKTTTISNTSIEDLFETAKVAGTIFTGAGQSIETFNASVAVLSKSGVVGSKAGTNLRSIMSKLASPTSQAQEVLEALGVSIMDSSGNMRDFTDIIDDLQKSTKEYGNAEQLAIFKILAGQEAMNGLNILVQAGADELRNMRTEIENSAGATEELATIFRSDTKASLDNFTSAIEGLAITFFKYMQPAINLILNGLTSLIELFNSITKDSKILKAIFISLGIVILATFAPISATIIGIVLLFGGLVKAFQYCYEEFEWFAEGIDAGVSFIKDVFFTTIETIKGFIDNALNVFKSFGDGFGTGFMNLLTLIRQGIYTLIITPIKWILIALSKLPSKLGGIGKAGLEALEKFENESFQYSFSNKDENQKNTKNDIGSIPTSKDITPAVLETKFGQDNNTNNNSNNNNANMTSINRYQNNRSTLDINITAPKNYGTSYSLNNPQSNPLLINVGNGQ